jgi:hypothetical protein
MSVTMVGQKVQDESVEEGEAAVRDVRNPARSIPRGASNMPATGSGVSHSYTRRCALRFAVQGRYYRQD